MQRHQQLLLFKKYRKPIVIIFAPILALAFLYVFGLTLGHLSGTSDVGLFDDLPVGSSPLQRMVHEYSWLIVLLMLTLWYFVLPICLILGVSMLLYRLFKKEA